MSKQDEGYQGKPYFCGEGLLRPIGSLVLTDIEGQIVLSMLTDVLANNSMEFWVEEATVIQNSLMSQLNEKTPG
jgi:hypothetical protein